MPDRATSASRPPAPPPTPQPVTGIPDLLGSTFTAPNPSGTYETTSSADRNDAASAVSRPAPPLGIRAATTIPTTPGGTADPDTDRCRQSHECPNAIAGHLSSPAALRAGSHVRDDGANTCPGIPMMPRSPRNTRYGPRIASRPISSFGRLRRRLRFTKHSPAQPSVAAVQAPTTRWVCAKSRPRSTTQSPRRRRPCVFADQARTDG